MRRKRLKTAMITVLVAVCLVTTAGIKKLLDAKRPAIPEADAGKVLQKLYAPFTDFNNSLNISGVVTLTDKGVVKEQTTFQLMRNRHQVYHRFDAIQHISNGKIALQLDTMNKYLVIARPDKQWLKQQKAGMLPFDVIAMLNDTANFKMRLIQSETEKAIEIINELQPDIKSCKLIYNPVDYTLQKAVVQWWKQPGSEANREYWETTIQYEYNKQPLINVEELLNSVVTIKKKKIAIDTAYSEYHVEITGNIKD